MTIAAAACGKGPHIVNRPPPTAAPFEELYPGPDAQTLQAMFDRRAQALLHGDQRAFLADLDPANTSLVQHEQMVFANLRQLAPLDVRFIFGGCGPTGLAGSATFRCPVIEVIQLQGDAGPPKVEPGETFDYDVKQSGRIWVVVDILPMTHSSVAIWGDYADAPWDLTPLRVVNVGDVQLAADASVPDLDQYAAAAQAQVSQVESLWGARPRFPKYEMFLTRDPNAFAAWYETSRPDAEGFTKPEEGVRTNGVVYTGQYVGARVVVNLASIAQVADDPAIVMRHELTHAVTARQFAVTDQQQLRVASASKWVVEGFARYVETLGFPSRAAAVAADVAAGLQEGLFAGTPPATASFETGDLRTVAFNYDVSSTVFTFIASLKGTSIAVDFYAHAVQVAEGAPLVSQPLFDSICEADLGMSAADFLSRWAAFVRSGG